jgi:hypothetical protein
MFLGFPANTFIGDMFIYFAGLLSNIHELPWPFNILSGTDMNCALAVFKKRFCDNIIHSIIVTCTAVS